jgi:FlaA1/EpsC-like NDP-sugar epimerase
MKIMVVGAAGSIGSELCRQLVRKYKVIAVDQDESGIFGLENVIPEIANIRDPDRIDELFLKYKPSVVFHAAAYKHLSNYEKEHLGEVVKTNVIGTLNLLTTAQKYGVKKFIFVSTDKAVNPTSLMGTTKLLGEIMTKRMGYTVVRFGNVIGSRGSIIPIWQKQHDSGKPLTVTGTKMERYFMQIWEACELLIKTMKTAKPGQTIILDMVKQRKIIDMAKFYFPKDKIRIISPKEGEKFSEELMTEYEKGKFKRKGKLFIIG